MSAMCNFKEESISDIREDLRRQVESLKQKASCVSISQDGNDGYVISNREWHTLDYANVKIRLCSLNALTDRTIANMQFGKGGYISPHTHDRIKRVYVLAGKYIDTVSGVEYCEGSVQCVPVGVLHGMKSDFCLLTVTWQPAFDIKSE